MCAYIGDSFLTDQIKKMLISIDSSFADQFELATFQLIMDRKVFKEMKKDDLVKAFKVFDKSNTGKINTAEFQKVIESVASENGFLTPEEVAEFVESADPKKQGSFSYEDFIKSLG